MSTGLDTEQSQAAESLAATIVVSAGPGSGKTRVLVRRIELEHERKGSAAGVIALTFTNAAANELKERLASIGCDGLQYCGTIHGLMLRHLMKHGTSIGLPKRLVVLDEDQTEELLENVIATRKLKCPKGDLRRQIAKGVDANDQPGMSNAEQLAHHFYRRLMEGGMLTYDTILEYGLRLLKHGAGIKCDLLLVDEVQDSGNTDVAIYKHIDAANKFYVGDSDQSIYGWRGANVKNMIDLNASSAASFKLFMNYRSGFGICSAAQRLVEHNPCRIDKKTIASTPEQDYVTTNRFDNEVDEIHYIAANVPVGKSAAVLCRTNALVEMYSKELGRRGVAVAVEQPPELPQDWKGTMMLLGLLADPDNDTLAEMFITERQGRESARLIAKTASASYKTINAEHLKIPHDLPLGQAQQYLRMWGASTESQNRLGLVYNELPDDASIQEFALAAQDVKFAAAQPEGTGLVITTYHRAKGREWHTVFLPAFEETIIPTGRPNADIEEERRLAFVGMTRAQRALHITSAKSRFNVFNRRLQPTAQSRFVKEALP